MTYQISVAQQHSQQAVVIEADVARDDIPQFLDGAFGELSAMLTAQGLESQGPPFARYRVDSQTFHVTAGMPVSQLPDLEGRAVTGQLPGGLIASTIHFGSYGDLPSAFHAVIDWLSGAGYRIVGDPWESYLDGPETAEPRTQVCFPAALAT